MSAEYITVGKLGRTRGLHGEIFVTPSTDFPDRFLGLKSIYVKGREGWENFKIVSTRIISGRPVLKFKDVNTPEDAARLTNRTLAVLKSEVFELPADRFYIFDLVGSIVYDHDSEELIGEITDVIQYPANDVYQITRPDKSLVFCPAVKQFVSRVDIENKKIFVDKNGLFNN